MKRGAAITRLSKIFLLQKTPQVYTIDIFKLPDKYIFMINNASGIYVPCMFQPNKVERWAHWTAKKTSAVHTFFESPTIRTAWTSSIALPSHSSEEHRIVLRCVCDIKRRERREQPRPGQAIVEPASQPRNHVTQTKETKKTGFRTIRASVYNQPHLIHTHHTYTWTKKKTVENW